MRSIALPGSIHGSHLTPDMSPRIRLSLYELFAELAAKELLGLIHEAFSVGRLADIPHFADARSFVFLSYETAYESE